MARARTLGRDDLALTPLRRALPLLVVVAGLAATAGLVSLTHGLSQKPAPAPEAGAEGLPASAAPAPPSGGRVPGFRRLTGVTALAILPGDVLAVGDAVGRLTLRPLSAPDTDQGTWWAAHDAPIRRLWAGDAAGARGAPAGTTVVSASADGSVAYWAPDGHLLRRLRLPDAHLNDAVPHPGDSAVYVAADRGTVARLCDPEPCWRHLGVHGAAAFAVAFSPDGARLATGGMDGQVALRDVVTGERTTQWRVGPGWVTALAWTPAGLFVGDNGGQVRLVPGGDPAAPPLEVVAPGDAAGPAGPVLVLRPVGPYVLAGTEGGQLWAIATGGGGPQGALAPRLAARQLVGVPVRAVAVQGEQVVVGVADGELRRYTLGPAGFSPAR